MLTRRERTEALTAGLRSFLKDPELANAIRAIERSLDAAGDDLLPEFEIMVPTFESLVAAGQTYINTTQGTDDTAVFDKAWTDLKDAMAAYDLPLQTTAAVAYALAALAEARVDEDRAGQDVQHAELWKFAGDHFAIAAEGAAGLAGIRPAVRTAR
jgi:hypothetical protein